MEKPEKKDPDKIREKRLLAKAFRKKLRRDLKKGRLSFSYGKDKDDPLGEIGATSWENQQCSFRTGLTRIRLHSHRSRLEA